MADAALAPWQLWRRVCPPGMGGPNPVPMRTHTPFLLSLLAVSITGSESAFAQRPRSGAVDVHQQPAAPGIAWFGVWSDALAEAQRTNRPILLMAAAPSCQGVPGVW